MAGTWWKGSYSSCNGSSSRSSCVVLLLLVALTAAASFAAFRSTAFSHTYSSWSVTRLQAVYAGSYGAEVIANLSDFKSGLLSTVLEAFDRSKTQPQGFKRWDNLKPFITCPPDRPLTRYGSSADGGKLLCDITKLPSPCVIYSLGSNGDYSFKLDMLKVTKCEIHTFDCTYDGISQDPSRHFYHKWCIGSSGAPGFKTWKEVTTALGHQQQRLDILKADIEGYEANVLTELRHDRPLPGQISMEFHMFPHLGVAPKTRPELALMHMHLASLGYAIVAQEDNIWAPVPCCAEWTFLLVEQLMLAPRAK